MLINKKLLVGGIIMVILGTIITVSLNAVMPVGQSGMNEEEIIDLLTRQQENQDMITLAGILIGIGFLLILISFGARRKKGNPEKEEKNRPYNNSTT